MLSFEEFAAARLPALLRYATAVTADRDLAQDVVQNVMIRVHARWRRVQALEHPETYVKRAIVNEFISWRRRWNVRTIRPGPVPERPSPDPTEELDARDSVLRRLADLPPRQRAVLALRYVDGMSDPEIAQLLGCTPGSVRGYASRALDTLRRDGAPDPVRNP